MVKRCIGFTLIGLFVVLNVSTFAADLSYEKIGQVKSRHAKEIHASNWSVGAETMDRDYTIYNNWKTYLGPLGVKKARIQGGWAKTEPVRGVYHWDWLDEIVYDMADQGVEPWICLCYGNPVYSSGGGTRLGAQLPAAPDALHAWRQWVAACVVRYRDVVDEWEVWNEPKIGQDDVAELYAALVIETAETIRSIQPDSTIIAMALAGVHAKGPQNVLQRVKEQGKLHLIDEISYHPYNKNPDASYQGVAELRAMIHRYSDRIPIVQGENGAPSEFRKTKALRNYVWSELSQAKWALRRMLGDLGRDIRSSYFSIVDMKYPDEINRKGLLKINDDKEVIAVKQAYYAVQNLASVFDDSLERIPRYPYSSTAKQSLSLFGYANRFTKQQIVTIWFDAEIPSDSNSYCEVEFTFPNAQFSKPVYVDLRTGFVYALPESAWERLGSVYHFRGIPIYDSPILIADQSAFLMQTQE